jgi:hypothetical protein
MGDFEMMKKTTSALAVAALLGTGAASAATFQVGDDSTINIGGDFQIVYNSTTGNGGEESTGFDDNASSLVFSGEHLADNGLTTFFNLDLDGFDATNPGVTSHLVTDEAHVGVSGNFGHVKVGSDVGVFDKYADYADVDQNLGVTSISDGDARDLVEYGNTVGNVEFLLQAELGTQDQGSTADNGSTTSLGAGFSADLGGVTLTGAYDQQANTQDDEPIYAVGVSTNIGGADLTLGYETDNQTNTIDLVTLAGSYSVGQTTFVGALQSTSYDTAPGSETEDSFTEFYAGVVYNVTSQMYVYGEMIQKDRTNDAGDNMAVGVYYGW